MKSRGFSRRLPFPSPPVTPSPGEPADCQTPAYRRRPGDDLHAREQIAYAQFLAGMTFNNASQGYVHAMAHQLGGFYDLPHGVCNAVPQPHVQAYNAQVSAMNDEQGAIAASGS